MISRGDRVKTWDVIIVGAGVIGLSLALELRKTGRTVLLVERGEPAREASHAAGGMLANSDDELPDALKPLADASARMYPEFVHELQDESGLHIDLRSDGTILFPAHSLILQRHNSDAETLIPARLKDLEPTLASLNRPGIYLKERSVDPRDLLAACVKAARHHGVDIASGHPISAINLAEGHVTGVSTTRTTFLCETVLNCSGAWAGQLGPVPLPIRPVKGQMLAVAMPSKSLLRHVVRSPEVYLIPRSDGRLVIGATLEEAGFNKQTVPETIKQLHQAALALLPDLQNARILEAWAGLRPGTPDNLPILGQTEIPGYFVASGHYRDGILLAPITAKLVGQVICGIKPEYDLERFSAGRFNSKAA
jgi:glycine oxidase